MMLSMSASARPPAVVPPATVAAAVVPVVPVEPAAELAPMAVRAMSTSRGAVFTFIRGVISSACLAVVLSIKSGRYWLSWSGLLSGDGYTLVGGVGWPGWAGGVGSVAWVFIRFSTGLDWFLLLGLVWGCFSTAATSSSTVACWVRAALPPVPPPPVLPAPVVPPDPELLLLTVLTVNILYARMYAASSWPTLLVSVW